MQDSRLAEKLAFLRHHRQQDEAALLAQALQAGLESLYREALIEAYLLVLVCGAKWPPVEPWQGMKDILHHDRRAPDRVGPLARGSLGERQAA